MWHLNVHFTLSSSTCLLSNIGKVMSLCLFPSNFFFFFSSTVETAHIKGIPVRGISYVCTVLGKTDPPVHLVSLTATVL